MESLEPGTDPGPALELRLLGPLTVRRRGAALVLPSSRKVRALIGYLALAPRPVARDHLCEVFWDVPDDPRGELRWCLSKIRGLLDEPDHRRVVARDDAVSLDLSDCFVDALALAEAAQRGFEAASPENLRGLAGLFEGEFLDRLDLDRTPSFTGWTAAQRRRFRGWHAVLLERLVQGSGGDEALAHLETWLRTAPLDRRAHELFLGALARRWRFREAEEHLDATVRTFEAEGLDSAPLREAWRSARAEVASPPAAVAVSPPGVAAAEAPQPRRASIAVMPFAEAGAEAPGGLADALVHDVITGLAGLRSLFVIAQGTVFALRDRRVGTGDAGRALDVDYVVGGSLQRLGGRIAVALELAEARSGRILWAEHYIRRLDDAFLVLAEIGHGIVASVAGEIEAAERNRAVLKPPHALDAWEAYHRGLWHMYRFNEADNAQARHFFEAALRLDPSFSRAYAGLSFTHWQNAFQGWAERERESGAAYDAAGRSLMADDRDPAAHWAMGRALWLRGRQQESVDELEQAVALSPNFALGHYSLAFVQSLGGDPGAAIVSSDQSRRLSPFDPLLFGMLGSRAMALLRLGRFDEAARCAVQAAARPNAHAHIQAIAAYCLTLAGRPSEGRAYLAAVQAALPRYGVGDFLTAMRFSPDGEALIREAAERLGGEDPSGASKG